MKSTNIGFAIIIVLLIIISFMLSTKAHLEKEITSGYNCKFEGLDNVYNVKIKEDGIIYSEILKNNKYSIRRNFDEFNPIFDNKFITYVFKTDSANIAYLTIEDTITTLRFNDSDKKGICHAIKK
jgi:hypothetical protein